MSKSQEMKYKCPYCGEEFTLTVYDSVNAQQDPDLRDRCVSGDIFRHSCPHCHKDFMLQNNLLYEDTEHRFVLWLSVNEVGDTLKKYAEPLIKNGYKLRRCSSLKEFTEKIVIFEDGLDDVEVELAKYDSFIEFIDNRQGKPEDVTSVEYQKIENDVLKINVRTADKGMSFLIPMNGLHEEMKENKDLYAFEETSFPCINADYIIHKYEDRKKEQKN